MRVVFRPQNVVIADPPSAANPVGDTIDEIRSHIQICKKRYGRVRMPVHVGGQATHIDLAHGIAHVNDPLVVRRPVANGAGLTLLPHHYCRGPLAEGSLVEVCRTSPSTSRPPPARWPTRTAGWSRRACGRSSTS